MTLLKLIKEIKNVPENKFEELYEVIHNISVSKKKSNSTRKKILSYSGIFKEMIEKEYLDYLTRTKNIRNNLFDRNSAA